MKDFFKHLKDFFKHFWFAIVALIQALCVPFGWLCKTIVGKVITAIVVVAVFVGVVFIFCKFKLNLF